MDDLGIQRRILGYLEHTNDENYLVGIAGALEASPLDGLIVELLLSGDYETVNRASLFVMDVVTLRPQHEKYDQFRESFSRSSVVAALESLLTAPSFWTRRGTAHTLGRTGSVLSLAAMHRAFRESLGKDPLLLPALAFEIFWLEANDSLSLIEKTVASGDYLTRWSALAMIEQLPSEESSGPDGQFCVRLLSLLASDTSARVRTEAEFRLALFDHEHDPDRMRIPKPKRRASRREIEKRQPSLCFPDLVMRFGNYLFHNGRQDYTVAELEQFVRQQPD